MKAPPSLAYRPAWLRDCRGNAITVVGADGFIGSHVCAAALAAGMSLRAICTREPWRLAGLPLEPEIRREWWEAEVGGETVALLAYDPPPSFELSAWMVHELEVNAAGALRLVSAAGRVVFASSADVYGAWHDEPVPEEAAPAPVTPYARAKLAVEEAMDGRNLCLRIATVYGPSEHRRRAIPAFIDALARGETALIHGDGSDVRDYVFVGDVAAAVVNACCGSGVGVLNVGSGKGRTTLEVLEGVARALGVRPSARFESSRRPPARLVLDVRRARLELAFDPRTDFEAALADEARYLLAASKSSSAR